MMIGDLARLTGTKRPTIRFYETIGLLRAPSRTASGRRRYGEPDLRRLAFIRHARDLGFDVPAVRSLLDLADDPGQDCAAIDETVQQHLAAVDAKLIQLGKLREELARISRSCAGGTVGDCSVLGALGDHERCASAHDR